MIGAGCGVGRTLLIVLGAWTVLAVPVGIVLGRCLRWNGRGPRGRWTP